MFNKFTIIKIFIKIKLREAYNKIKKINKE